MADAPGALPLLVRGHDVTSGDVVRVRPDGLLRSIDFRVLRLRPGETFKNASAANETGLVLLSGTADVTTSDNRWSGLGRREDPFSGPPTAVYLPRETPYEVRAASAVELAVCEAPGRRRLPARLIDLPQSAGYVRGEGHAQRRVFNILMEPGSASSLFLTEVITFPGNWSSYPPHKHDTDDPPRESQLEELYYYRAQPKQGFAFQRVYTASGDLDETVTARDTDVVLVPRGYHVCSAAANYTIYYLNVLAGPKHLYHMSFDPEHAWIKEGWTW
jgi:5-deoxy-glucuronate isomerase